MRIVQLAPENQPRLMECGECRAVVECSQSELRLELRDNLNDQLILTCPGCGETTRILVREFKELPKSDGA